MKYNLLFY